MNSLKIGTLVPFDTDTDQLEYRSSDVLADGATKSYKTDLVLQFSIVQSLS